jgi:hypothetical protein
LPIVSQVGKVFGTTAKRVISGLVALNSLGNIITIIFAQSRVSQELAKECVLLYVNPSSPSSHENISQPLGYSMLYLQEPNIADFMKIIVLASTGHQIGPREHLEQESSSIYTILHSDRGNYKYSVFSLIPLSSYLLGLEPPCSFPKDQRLQQYLTYFPLLI